MQGRQTRRWLTPFLVLLLLLGFAAVAQAQGGDITRGSQIYDANCAVCHGADGKGRVGADLSQDFPAINPNAFLSDVISKGVAGSKMPAWSQANGGPLDDQNIADVVAFVESLSGGRSPMAPTATPFPVTPVPTVPGASGDASQGQTLFVENCVMCHGADGKGRVGANLSKAFSSIDPQQYIRTTVARGVDGSAMPAWSTDFGGPLSEAEIDDISAYIVALSKQAQAVEPEPAPPPANTAPGLLAVIGLILIAVVMVVVLQMTNRQKSG